MYLQVIIIGYNLIKFLINFEHDKISFKDKLFKDNYSKKISKYRQIFYRYYIFSFSSHSYIILISYIIFKKYYTLYIVNFN